MINPAKRDVYKRQLQPQGIIYSCNPNPDFQSQVEEMAQTIPLVIISNKEKTTTVDAVSYTHLIASRLEELLNIEGVEAEEKAVRYVAKAGDGSMRDALSLLDQCIAFYLGQTLTYDKVLEVLGAVDTEVFSKLLRRVIQGDVTGSIPVSYTHLNLRI